MNYKTFRIDFVILIPITISKKLIKLKMNRIYDIKKTN
jgi:hypothetical protein